MTDGGWPWLASGEALDWWAGQLGAVPRDIVLDESETHVIDIRTGMPVLTDDAFRKRILARLRVQTETLQWG